MWNDVYQSWTSGKFPRKVRVERATFKCILDEIRQDLIKICTPMVPHPIPPVTQLAPLYITWHTDAVFQQ